MIHRTTQHLDETNPHPVSATSERSLRAAVVDHVAWMTSAARVAWLSNELRVKMFEYARRGSVST